jgi:putative flavoprotein involved in K+ transport
MTSTLDASPATAADRRAQKWFDAFEDALRARDVDRAAGQFARTSFWRDLVAFSWNTTTVEDRAGVTDLLTATLDRTDPSGFAVSVYLALQLAARHAGLETPVYGLAEVHHRR